MTDTSASTLLGGGQTNGGIIDPNAAGGAPMADASDPMAGLNLGNVDSGPTGLITTRSRNRPYSTGAIPMWWNDAATGEQLMAYLGQMSDAEALQLKQRLWYAGFYDEPGSGPQSIYKGGIPTTGSIADSDRQAFANLISATASTGLSLDETLENRMTSMREVHRDAAVDAYDIPGTVAMFQKMAGSSLNRQLTDQEIEDLLKEVSGPQPRDGSYDIAALQGGDPATYTGIGGAPTVAPQTLGGGGPDSTAIQYGKALATSFGLTVTQDYTVNGKAPFPEYAEGRGVTISGSKENLARLHDWATSQKGPGGQALFGQVQMLYDNPGSDQPTGVALVVNQGATRPNTSVNLSGNDDTARFLEAIKRPGPDEAVFGQWDGEGAERRGAYGISDGIWNYYTSQLGIDTDDHSRDAQTRVAAVYAQDLYKRYGNWEDVAMAFRKNETEANRRNDYRRFGVGAPEEFDHSDDEWVRQAIDDMGNNAWNRQWGGPAAGTDTYSQQYGDGSIPYVDFTDATASNDPRWWQQRVQRAWDRKYRGAAEGANLAKLVIDLMGPAGAKKQISQSDY